MTELSARRLAEFERIVTRLDESLALPADSVSRDSAILRFELAFELAWKTCQAGARREGFEVASPRQAFERAFQLGWIVDEVLWAEILEARNLAVHVYREELADRMYARLPAFAAALRDLGTRLRTVCRT